MMVDWGLGVGGGGGRGGGGGHGAGVGDEERMIEEEAIKQTFYHLTSFILPGFFLSTRPCISHYFSRSISLCCGGQQAQERGRVITGGSSGC